MAKAAVLGDPLDPKTQLGPIATQAEYDKMLKIHRERQGEDRRGWSPAAARPRSAARGCSSKRRCSPTRPTTCKISREEIFGPVVPVIPFEGEDEAIRLANDTATASPAGIQTARPGKALRLADRIKAGTVWLNTWHKYHPNAPFGGYKMSGYGREQGAEALENYTQYKTIWANLES